MKHRPMLTVTGLILAIGIGLIFFPVRQGIAQLEGLVKSLGSLGPIAFAAGYVLTTVLFIPGSAMTIGAGSLFGLKTGFLVVLVGANGGALGAFLLARTFLRKRVARWAEATPKFYILDRAIERQGFKVVFLSRLSPAFPFTLLNYFLGLTAVRTWIYVLANLVGMLPGMFLYVYLGAAARDAIAGQADVAAGFYQQLLKYLGLLATVAVVAVVARSARKALRETEQA